jgi:hypothetical protein
MRFALALRCAAWLRGSRRQRGAQLLQERLKVLCDGSAVGECGAQQVPVCVLVG